MIFKDLSISLNERERCSSKAPAKFVEFWIAARSALSCSLLRKKDKAIQTRPKRMAPSTTERCLIGVCQFLVTFIIRWMSPVLQSHHYQLFQTISGHQLIFRQLHQQRAHARRAFKE